MREDEFGEGCVAGNGIRWEQKVPSQVSCKGHRRNWSGITEGTNPWTSS